MHSVLKQQYITYLKLIKKARVAVVQSEEAAETGVQRMGWPSSAAAFHGFVRCCAGGNDAGVSFAVEVTDLVFLEAGQVLALLTAHTATMILKDEQTFISLNKTSA